MKSKTEKQQLHAKRRAEDRFGIKLNQENHLILIKQIQTGKACFYENQSHRITAWIQEINGQIFKSIYDKSRHQLVTFLYPTEEEIETYKKYKERKTTKETTQ